MGIHLLLWGHAFYSLADLFRAEPDIFQDKYLTIFQSSDLLSSRSPEHIADVTNVFPCNLLYLFSMFL